VKHPHPHEGSALNPIRATARKLHVPLPLVADVKMRANGARRMTKESNGDCRNTLTGDCRLRRGPRFRCTNLMSRLGLLLAGLVATAPALQADAQDRVIIQQPGGSRFPISGLIDDYTGREVRIQVRTGDPLRRYPRQEVIEVQTAYTPHHEKGRQFLAAGKPAEAKAELSQALKEEDRIWVRREILSQLVRCALWDGNYRAATPWFLSIVESDPETLHYGLAPLAWSDVPSEPAVKLAARNWMADRSPESQLIGASHLLFDRELNDQAEVALRRLARESNVKLQRLAQMQLWRVRSQGGTATPGELTRWELAIDELPEELRIGGYFVLGQTYKRQHQPERAAGLLLWVPLVYDADRHLAARACFDAAELVESYGDLAQAANLYSEVAFRFGDTPLGGKGDAKWRKLRETMATPERPDKAPAP
jgi:tetratricopeptide (TPR) repeat protein